MALFTTYYDTSRTEHTEHTSAMVTAGVVMSEAQLLRFCAQWENELKLARIPFLHMNELAKHFAGRDGEKQVFLSRVLNMLRRRVTKTFAVVLDLDDYAEMDGEFYLSETMGDPFSLCAGSCVYMADAWIKQAMPNQPRAHFHERGDEGIGAVQAFARRHSIDLHTLPAQNEHGVWFAPFQAVDFLAWELRRAHEQLYSPPRHPFRPQIENIASGLKLEIHNYNRVWLREKLLREGVATR